MCIASIEENRAHLEEHREEWLLEHCGKHLLLHNKMLIESFDTYNAAAERGVEMFGLDGAFLVHHLTDQEQVNFILGAIL